MTQLDDMDLLELFNYQVELHPEKNALINQDRHITYDELYHLSNRIARRLARIGITPDAVVGIHANSGIRTVSAMLATMQLGAAWVVLDPAAPQASLQALLDDAQPAIVLIDGEDIPFDTAVVRQIRYSVLMEERQGTTEYKSVLGRSDASLLCVMYATDSTHGFKPVYQTDGDLLKRLRHRWRAQLYAQSEESVGKTTFSAMDGLSEVFGPLLSGNPPVILDSRLEISIESHDAFQEKQDVDTIKEASRNLPFARIAPSVLEDLYQRFPAMANLYPLTPRQTDLLFNGAMEEGYSGDTLQLLLEFPHDVHELALRAALQELVDRHTALRATIVWSADGPLQLISDTAKMPWKTIDLGFDSAVTLDAAEVDNAVQTVIDRDNVIPLSLTQQPLSRATFIRKPDGTAILIWLCHSIIIDSRSLSILSDELAANYHAHIQRIPNTLQGAPDFQEYADWLASQNIAVALSHWKTRAAGLQLAPSLSIGRTIEAESGIRGVKPVELDASVVESMQRLCVNQDISISTVLQSALLMLMSGYANRQAATVAVAVSARPSDIFDAQRAVGAFENVLPLTMDVPANDVSVLDWLVQVQNQHALNNQFSYVPVSSLFEEAGIPKGARISDCLLVVQQSVLQNTAHADSESPDNIVVRSIAQPLSYPLTFCVSPEESDTAIEIHYDSGRFSVDEIDAMAFQLVSIFHQIGATEIPDNGDQPACKTDISPTDPSSRDALLEAGRGRQEKLSHRNIGDALISCSRALSSSVAIVEEERNTTFLQLEMYVNAFDEKLDAASIGKGSVVALFMEKSLGSIVSALAILRRGAIVMPLDTDCSTELLRYRVEDCCAELIISEMPVEHFAPEIPVLAVSSVLEVQLEYLDTLLSNDGALSSDNSPSTNAPTDIAYILYTTDASDKPKGTRITHQGILNSCQWRARALPFNAKDIVLHSISQASIDSVVEFLSPLLSGVPLVIAKSFTEYGFSGHRQLIEKHRITRLTIKPSELVTLFIVGGKTQQLSSLKYLICYGEAFDSTFVKRCREVLPDAVIVKVYGSAELSGDASCFVVKPAQQLQDSSDVPMGFAVDNCQLLVLDENARLLPFGLPGELYVGGEFLAAGYLNDPDSTAESFVPNPYGSGNLYRTGVSVQMRVGGCVEYVEPTDSPEINPDFSVSLANNANVDSGKPSESAGSINGSDLTEDEANIDISPPAESFKDSMDLNSLPKSTTGLDADILAALTDMTETKPASPSIGESQNDADKSGVPLKLAQLTIWNEYQASNQQMNIAIEAEPVELPSASVQRIEEIIQAIHAEQSSLRTLVANHNGTPRHSVSDMNPPEIARIQVPSMIPLKTVVAFYQRRLSEQSFDIKHGPMWRVCILEDDSSSVLLACFCSLVFDSASMQAFYDQLNEQLSLQN